jgi:hypothetical protein
VFILKIFKILISLIIVVAIVTLFTGCDLLQSPFEQQIDRQNFAQENAQDMADQMMGNVESFGQFMPDIENVPPINIEETTTEIE